MDVSPAIVVIFGGAGDLTWRKLMPSLFDLHLDGRMPKRFAIIPLDRAAFHDAQLHKRFLEGVQRFSRKGKVKSTDWNDFARHVIYQQGDFKDPITYSKLEKSCAKLEKDWKVKAGRIFHMATPPVMFGVIPKLLGDAGLNRDRVRARIVVEKPIGQDLNSARELNRVLTESFHESQIFRIDHYLGKETVQNILAFRFANPLFEPIWDRRYVDYVTITVAEEVGVEHRGSYYEQAGALRDMVQNHLMLLCLVAMEPMVSFDADEIRNKKVDVLHAVRPIRADEVRESAVRGQYGEGSLNGKKLRGYRQEDEVSSHSKTETFAALKLFVDNWRWQGVPFYLRTGKRLPRQVSEVAIQFRRVPHQSFPPAACRDWHPSCLVLSIQPDEGIVLRFQAKYPGPEMLLRPVEMRFSYQESFAAPSPDAYETLLWDVMNNDATLFMRVDQIEAAWRLLMPVLEEWANSRPRSFPNYAAHLPYKKGRSYEDYLGLAGLERQGKKKWQHHVAEVVQQLKAAMQVDYVVLGGGNARLLKKLPPGASREQCRCIPRWIPPLDKALQRINSCAIRPLSEERA
ncbi:MAG: glucose-6-phosphate dehydrogenase [Acidobacteria bacterium]|nr:glucose-6-phosphate dehydrogenase [Acidobacteriota bacterium]